MCRPVENTSYLVFTLHNEEKFKVRSHKRVRYLMWHYFTSEKKFAIVEEANYPNKSIRSVARKSRFK